MTRTFGPRRGAWLEVTRPDVGLPETDIVEQLTRYDLVYRSLCLVLYNYAQSGHPGSARSMPMTEQKTISCTTRGLVST